MREQSSAAACARIGLSIAQRILTAPKVDDPINTNQPPQHP